MLAEMYIDISACSALFCSARFLALHATLASKACATHAVWGMHGLKSTRHGYEAFGALYAAACIQGHS